MRRKCPVCGLYVGAKPHSGPIHDRIFKQRARFASSSKSGLRGRLRKRRA